MKTTTEIVNLVSKALRSRPIKWVDINKIMLNLSMVILFLEYQTNYL